MLMGVSIEGNGRMEFAMELERWSIIKQQNMKGHSLKDFAKGKEYITSAMEGPGRANGVQIFKMEKEFTKISRVIFKRVTGRWGKELMRTSSKNLAKKGLIGEFQISRYNSEYSALIVL